jgi:hypothetical protein
MSSKSRSHSLPSLRSSPQQVKTFHQSTPKIVPQSSSFIDTLKDGFAFSIGSNLAERAVSSILPRTITHQQSDANPDCNEITRIYKEQVNPSSTLEEAFNKCKK